jgi:hypothetical protein
MPPGPREWVVGHEVVIRFNQPPNIPADLVSLSLDGRQIAVFGPSSSYTWDAGQVSNGPHKLRLAAQTASGRETWAVEQPVIVDNRPPLTSESPRTSQKSGAATGQKPTNHPKKKAAGKQP